MTGTTMDARPLRAAWHFWVVIVLALLWNGWGGYDMVVMYSASPAYLELMLPYRRAWYDAFHNLPVWLQIVSAIASAAGVLGTMLLTFRRSWAAWAFAIPLLITAVWMVYALSLRSTINTAGVVTIVVGLAVISFEIWYCRAMTDRGLLR